MNGEQSEGCLHQLFEAIANKSPEATAIQFGTTSISYHQLNSRANKLAQHLKVQGAGPDTLIALCVHRSIDMVVAMLGILKAGSAYIPLDPQYPRERIQNILTDSQAKTLITESTMVGELQHAAEQLISLDKDIPEHLQFTTLPNLTADNLAYVIYTSGSTGKPKGVQITHRNVVNFLRSMQRDPGLTPKDVVLAVTTVSFDISILEIFLPLITGAKVVLVDQPTASDAQRLMEHMDHVTVMQATPATWRMLIAAGWTGRSDLKILCGGEALPRDLAESLHKRCKELWNMYGPTETTVWSSIYRVPKDLPADVQIIPIGTPIAHTGIEILDETGQRVSAGATGELCISGMGVARGYLHRDQLTKEKFIDCPWDSCVGRIYRTGDLARRCDDGTLEYQGRIDHQVKVRGFRIELGEIEAVLMNHPAVTGAAVITRDEEFGDKMLVAYVVSQRSLSQNALRDHLRATLPDYMLPNIFVSLDHMPLTPNGKIDRRALPDPDGLRPALERAYCPPRNETEERLAHIWSQVLGINGIGRDDHFLALGGHSLKATQIITRIKDEFAVDLSFQQFFVSSTIAKQATVIAAGGEKLDLQPPSIRPKPHTGRNPLSFAQQRLWYIDKLEGAETSYNMVEAFRLRGPLRIDILEQAFNYIIQRHDILRTTYGENNGVPCQIIAPNVPFQIERSDLEVKDEADSMSAINDIAVQEAYHHFDLEKDVLLRVQLITMDMDQYILMINMQHIISDEWSMGILFDELSLVYGSLLHGEAPPLSPLPVQYTDFARWQQEWLKEDVIDAKMEYWREQLRNVPTTLDLPTDFQREGPRRAVGANERLLLDAELRQNLEAFSTRQGVTLFMTLWAAFAALIARHTRQQDMVIATTMANRNHAEIESLIGFFINVLPLRVDLSGDPLVTDFLAQVRKVALEAFHHQDLPLDKLIEKLHFSRGDLDRLPLSQVAFNFQNGPKNMMTMDNVDITPLDLETQVSTTELALLMSEKDGGLQAVFEYSTVLFRPGTIARLAKQYKRILEAMLDMEGATLTDIAIASGLADIDGEDTAQEAYFNSYLRKTNLTGNQLLVWLGQQLDTADPIYNSVITYTLNEAIDPHHFKKAFQKVVACRDSLRTVIVEKNGIPQQVVQDNPDYQVTVKDFSTATDPEGEIRTWIVRQSQTAFSLDGCLFTCALLKAAANKYVWYMGQHHIITDGWSQALVYHDLSGFYQQSLAGQLEDCPHRGAYQDYVIHECELRDSVRYAKAKSYWDNQFNLETDLLRYYGKRPVKQSTGVKRLSLKLGETQSERIIAAARAVNPQAKSLEAAKFNVFITLYALFIQHISGQREFNIGIPLHNRRAQEFKQVTGLIMQVVPVRISIEDEDTFETLLKRISRTVLKAMQHGQYVMRNPDHAPLYDVVLNYHMWKGPNFHTSPAGVEWVHPAHAQESLSLQVHDFEQEMRGKANDIQIDLDFHVDVFDEEVQQLALKQFAHLINLYAEDISRPLNTISLLTEQDHDLLANTVNATTTEPNDTCLHQLIEQQVSLRPQAIAVADDYTQLTYEQLDSRANQLAHFLRERGVRSESRVGILVDRSPDMIIGLLAILKSGGCYVPLDPKSPPERLKGILNEALEHEGEAALILTQSHLVDKIPDTAGQLIKLDRDYSLWKDQSTTPPPRMGGVEHLAYIIYTSGSTGKPKGVMIEHRSIVNYTLHSIQQYELTAADKVLQFSSITFDAAGEEIYPVLSAGGTLVLRDEESIRSPEAFIKKCNRHRISLLSMPTTYFHQLTAAANTSTSRFGDHLRMILFGGERVFPQEIQRWRQAYPRHPRLVNTYGPTEATVVATTYILPNDQTVEESSGEIPIGKPVRNAQIFVLNHHRQLVGIGIPGELCIGGVGVARGYLNRPELTAERFLAHPLRPERAEKIYRTGDLVRLCPDGNLEFLGRVDDQVKVRGYRIELGEIESALKDHPSVSECAVLARPNERGDLELEAYVVLKERMSEEVTDWRLFLKERLPEYMVPVQFYRLERFPVTTQGKVDRKMLPEMRTDNMSVQTEYVPPANAIEEQLVVMWQKILNVEQIGTTADFFELGGHSLLATQIISRVQQSFQVDLSLRSLFAEPTIRALAKSIAESKENSPAAPAIARISRDKHRMTVTTQGDLMEVKK